MERSYVAVWASDEWEPEPCPTGYVAFDPRDPASVRAARRALGERLGLRHVPALCPPPRPNLLSRLVGALRARSPRRAPVVTRPARTVLVPIA